MNHFKNIICIIFLIVPFHTLIAANNEEIPTFWRGIICCLIMFGVVAIIKYLWSLFEDWMIEERKREREREIRNKEKQELVRIRRQEELLREKARREKAEAEAKKRAQLEEKERIIREERDKHRIWFGDEKDYVWDLPSTSQNRHRLEYSLYSYFEKNMRDMWGYSYNFNDMFRFFMNNLHYLGFENVSKFSDNTIEACYQDRKCYVRLYPFSHDVIDVIERDYKEFLIFVRENKVDGFLVVSNKWHRTLYTLAEKDSDIHYIDCADIQKILAFVAEKQNVVDKEDDFFCPEGAIKFPLYFYEKYDFSRHLTVWNFYILDGEYSNQSLYDFLLNKPRSKGSYAIVKNKSTLYTPCSGRFNCIINSLRFVIEGASLRNTIIRDNWYSYWSNGRPSTLCADY